MNLQKIIDEIEGRKICLERKDLNDWLFEYATEYQKHSREKMGDIIIRKAKDILHCADVVYWKSNKPYKLIFNFEEIPEVVKDDLEETISLYREI